MTKREVIRTLLDKKLPDRVGLNESFWPFIIENAWGAQGMPAGTDFITRFDLDIRSLCWCAVPEPRPDLAAVVAESDEWIAKRDGWGSTFKYWKTKAGTPEHMGFTITSPEVWKRDFRDAVRALDMRKLVKFEELKAALEKGRAGDEFLVYSGILVFEEMRRILGDVFMLEALLLEKDFLHDFNTIIVDKHIEFYDAAFREAGKPDGMYIYEDLGYVRGPFASPACHREMVLPHHKRLFRFFKDHGLPIVVHTCGDFRPHLDSLVEAGTDCVQTLEAKTGMNVLDLAKQYKTSLCFMGNLDVRVFESGDRRKIREECLTKLNGMKALRAPYIFMSDHSISTGVKLADYEYALELYRANCRY